MFILYFPQKWCTGMISDGDKYTDQPTHPGYWACLYLPLVQNCSTSMEVGSVLHICHISVEQVGPDYPEMCCPLHLTWPSGMAMSQWPHCLQMALGMRFLYAQSLTQVHHPWPALSWGWVANSFYIGSSCAPPHP